MSRAGRINSNLLVRESVFLFCILCSLILSGCGDSGHSSSSSEDDAVSFRWTIANPDAAGHDASVRKTSVRDECNANSIAYVQAIVYEDQSKREAARSENFPCTDEEGKIDGVKPNTDIRIVLVGLDEQDNIVYRGQSNDTFKINPGGTTKIPEGHIPIHPMRLPSPTVKSDHGSIMVSWDKWDESVGVSSYLLYMDNIEIHDTSGSDISTEETFTATISSLKSGFEYCFSVAAKDEFGNAFIPGPHACGTLEKNYTKLDADGVALANDPTTWEMVRDEDTGLVWEVKKDTDAAVDDRSHLKQFTYQAAEDYISDLNSNTVGGITEWRMPNLMELVALVETDISRRPAHNIAVDETYFPNVNNLGSFLHARYWTSTVVKYSGTETDSNWAICYGEGGRTIWSDREGKSLAVRAVYGPVTELSPDYLKFVDNGDGTITDTGTQLMWQKASFTGVGNQKLTWAEAADKINELNELPSLGGYNDWRMPKIKELISILEYTDHHRPRIDGSWFDNEAPELVYLGFFWSSTMSERQFQYREPNHDYVYVANFYDGGISDSCDTISPSENNSKFDDWNQRTYYIRAVRSTAPVNVTID